MKISYFHVCFSVQGAKSFHSRKMYQRLHLLAYEGVNHIENTSFGGNLTIKMDITKAFDTSSWSFLIHILKRFNFNSSFCHWIHTTLTSAHLFISINGFLHVFPIALEAFVKVTLFPLLLFVSLNISLADACIT